MKTVQIRLGIQYIECDLAPEFAEHAPQLRVYLDGHFQRKPVDVKLDEYNLEKQYSVTVSGKLPRSAGPLPKTAAIGIASFVQRKNEFGAPCLMDAGTTHVTLGEVCEEIQRHGVFEKQVPLLLHTTKELGKPGATALEKGKIKIRIEQNDLDVNNISFVSSMAKLSAPVEQVTQSMIHYIETTMEMENRMGETIPGTDRVRCPFYYGEAGLDWQELEQEGNALNNNIEANVDYMLPAVPLPAPAYMRYEIPETNQAFWDNAFQTVMERDGMTIHDYKNLSWDDKAATMIKTNVFLVQYLDYISDTVERNNRHQEYQARLKQGYENFGDPLVTWSGDCEDDATGIAQTFSAFQRFPFEKGTPLKEMQDISTNYMPIMTLAVVHGAKTGDEEDAPLGAHMYCHFLPKEFVRTALARTEQGRVALGKLQWSQEINPVGHAFKPLTGEGTGMFQVDEKEDPLLDARREIYCLSSLRTFKKPITKNTFYVGLMNGFTPEWMDMGSNIGGLWFATKQPDGRVTRGALYDSTVHEKSNFCIVPQPPLPRNILNVINETTLLRVPPNDLKITNPTAPIRNALLDRIVERVGNKGGVGDIVLPVYIRPHQLDKSLADKMARELSEHPRISKLDYVMERVTDQVYGYRLMLHVK